MESLNVDNVELECGAVSFRLGDITRILNSSHANEISNESRSTLSEFEAITTRIGYEATTFFRLTLAPGTSPIAGIRQLTEDMRARRRGEHEQNQTGALVNVEIKKIIENEA